jgi:arylsulfatase A-like enzyme
MSPGAQKGTFSWFATVGLGGSVLGMLEGLWWIWHDPPVSSIEGGMVLAWGSLAYAGPALCAAGAGLVIARVTKRGSQLVTWIPGALVSLGFWIVVLVGTQLYARGLLASYLLEFPAGMALAFGLCLMLWRRWPATLNSIGTWVLLQLLTLSAAGLWMAARYATGGQLLVLILIAAAGGGCCLWGLVRPTGRAKALAVAGGLPVIVVSLLALWPRAHGEAREKNTEHRKNVVLVTIDTLRADHMGSYGHTGGQTPAMDRLAAKGVVFEEAFSPTPFTCPSHGSILTGLDPFQHGAVTNHQTPVRTEVPTLAEMLSGKGYETAAFISGWTLKHVACALGTRFDTFFEDFSPWAWLPQSATKIGFIHNLMPVAEWFGLDFKRVERPAGQTTDAVLTWLEQSHDRPFFLWVHYFDPHLPFTPPPPYDGIFNPDYTGAVNGRWYELNTQAREKIVRTPADLHHMIALYDGEVAYVDSQIHRLLEALTRLGLERNTLVILTSDHGESHGEHDRYFARDLHRPSLHVPLILRFPPGEVRPTRIPEQVRLVDIAPTILDYLQIEVESDFAGESLLPLISLRKGKKQRPVLALFDPGGFQTMFAIQDMGYKLIWYSGWWNKNGLRVPPKEELYDLQRDPQESANILEQAPPALPDLSQRLTRWRNQELSGRREPTGEIETILKSLGYVR